MLFLKRQGHDNEIVEQPSVLVIAAVVFLFAREGLIFVHICLLNHAFLVVFEVVDQNLRLCLVELVGHCRRRHVVVLRGRPGRRRAALFQIKTGAVRRLLIVLGDQEAQGHRILALARGGERARREHLVHLACDRRRGHRRRHSSHLLHLDDAGIVVDVLTTLLAIIFL